MKAQAKYLRIDQLVFVDEFRRQKPNKPAQQSEFQTLELSLKEVGLSDPFVVYKQGTEYLLCDGYIRFDIIKGFLQDNIANPIDTDRILCEIVDDPNITPAQLRIEANKRSPVSPTQMAEGFRDLTKRHRMSIREIGPKFGLSHQSIANYLEILKCIPEVQTAIDKKIYPMSAGKQFCVLNPRGQKKVYDALIGKYGNLDRFFRSQIEKEKNLLSDTYFVVSKEQRMKRSEKLREKKKGATVRKPLERFLLTSIERVEEESRLLDIMLIEKKDHYLKFLKRWEIALRVPEIKRYVRDNYADDYNSITRLISQEYG